MATMLKEKWPLLVMVLTFLFIAVSIGIFSGTTKQNPRLQFEIEVRRKVDEAKDAMKACDRFRFDVMALEKNDTLRPEQLRAPIENFTPGDPRLKTLALDLKKQLSTELHWNYFEVFTLNPCPVSSFTDYTQKWFVSLSPQDQNKWRSFVVEKALNLSKTMIPWGVDPQIQIITLLSQIFPKQDRRQSQLTALISKLNDEKKYQKPNRFQDYKNQRDHFSKSRASALNQQFFNELTVTLESQAQLQSLFESLKTPQD